MSTKTTEQAEPPKKKQMSTKTTEQAEPPKKKKKSIDDYEWIGMYDLDGTAYVTVREVGHFQLLRTTIHTTEEVDKWDPIYPGPVCFDRKERLIMVVNEKRREIFFEYDVEDKDMNDPLMTKLTRAVKAFKNEVNDQLVDAFLNKTETKRLEDRRVWCNTWFDRYTSTAKQYL